MKKKRYGMGRLALALCVVIMWGGAAHAADDKELEGLLQDFERQPSVATANSFMDVLLREELLEAPVHFTPQVPEDSLRQQVYYWAAEWFYDQQQYDRSVSYGQKALPFYSKDNDKQSDCYNIVAIALLRNGHVEQAAEYAKHCLEITMRTGDDDQISSSMNTVAGIYMAGNQPKEAEQYILGAIKHISRVNNPQRKAVILGMASEVYHSLGDDTKTLSYAEQALQIDSALGRHPQIEYRLSQKGSALLGLHKYQEAENIFRQIIPALKEVGDWHSAAIEMNRLGMALFCQKRQREAIPYYKEAASLFAKMGDLYNEIHSHRGLYESYWDLDADSAKLELDRFNLLKDSLYSHSTAESLARYHAEFGVEQLQQENAKAHQATVRTVIIAIAVCLLLFVVGWLLILYLRRKQQKQTREFIQEVEMLRKKAQAAPSEEPTAETPSTDADESSLTDDDRQFLMHLINVVGETMPSGNFSVKHIASEMNMSVSTFRRRLQNATGESPKAYISAIQMEQAANLLTDSPDMSVAQVASRCGFDDTSSFSHTFKRVYGCSPTQFREK